ILPTATPAMAPATDTVRIALHIHAYYPDMLGEILRCLHRNRTRPDLFISVKDAEAQVMASQALAHYDGAVCAIEVVPNRGRDIGPFLTTFGARLVRDYDLIGHIHTKRSTHADRVVIDMWRNFLMQNLLGGDNSGP